MLTDAVITGMGCCTPLGLPASQLAEAVEGASAVATGVLIPDDLAIGEVESIAAVSGPEPGCIVGLRRPFPDRPTLMAIVAVDEAIGAAGLETHEESDGYGVILNTCFGPSQTVERFLRTLLVDGPKQVSAIVFSRAVSNSVVGELSRRHRLRGPSTALLGSCAIGYAYDLITAGRAEGVVCVGVDEVRDLHLWAYRHAGLMDRGMTLGEGAACLVIERADSAAKRGAQVVGRIAGYSLGFCPDSVHRITEVTAEALICCMAGALCRSGRSAADVEWIISIANGDARLEETERSAVTSVFGRQPKWIKPKLVLGECFGASEGLATIVGACALQSAARKLADRPTCLVNTCQVGGSVSSVLLEGVR